MSRVGYSAQRTTSILLSSAEFLLRAILTLGKESSLTCHITVMMDSTPYELSPSPSIHSLSLAVLILHGVAFFSSGMNSGDGFSVILRNGSSYSALAHPETICAKQKRRRRMCVCGRRAQSVWCDSSHFTLTNISHPRLSLSSDGLHGYSSLFVDGTSRDFIILL